MPEIEQQKSGRKQMSPEARARLSELAKERHARGEFGGAKFGKLGGRPKKDRAAKRVAEAAQAEENARKIINVFKDAIHPSQPMGIRLKAAEAWLNVEREEAKILLQEERHADLNHSRDELLDILKDKLTSGPAAEILRKRLEAENIPDAVVVEENDG